MPYYTDNALTSRVSRFVHKQNHILAHHIQRLGAQQLGIKLLDMLLLSKDREPPKDNFVKLVINI